MKTEDVRAAVGVSLSKMEVLARLGYEESIGNYSDLTSIIKAHNIDISHFVLIKATDYLKR